MFSDVEIREGLAIYKEILDARQVTKKYEPDAIPLLRMEAEMCHAQRLLRLIGGEESFDKDVTSQQRVLEVSAECFSGNHPYTTIEQRRLLELYEQHANLSMTYELYEMIHSSWRALYGPEYPEVLRARTKMLLSQKQAGAHHYQILPGLNRQRYLALRIFKNTHHPSAIEHLGYYASILFLDPMASEEALALMRQVVKWLEDSFGLWHTETILVMGKLGDMLCQSGGSEYNKGIKVLRRGLDLAASFLSIGHPLARSLWEEILS